MTKDLPTDPLADASTGVVRRSRGAFLKTMPTPRVERRDRSRQSRYTGPERRTEPEKAPEPKRVLGLPRWLLLAGAVYLALLVLVLAVIFTA